MPPLAASRPYPIPRPLRFSLLWVATLLASWSALGAQPSAAPVEILTARLAPTESGVDLELVTTARPTWTASYEGAGRFVLTLDNALPGPDLSNLPASGDLLAGVRFERRGSSDTPATRVVVSTRGPLANGVVAEENRLVVRFRPTPPLAPRAAALDETMTVIAEPCLNLRTRPSPDAPVVDCLASGVRVTVLERRGGWCRVDLADGRGGWVSRSYLEPTSPPSASAASTPRPEAAQPSPVLQPPVAGPAETAEDAAGVDASDAPDEGASERVSSAPVADDREGLESRLSALLQSQIEANQTISSLEQGIELLSASVEQLEEQRDRLNATLSDRDRQLDESDAALRESNESADRLRDELGAAKAESASRGARVAELEASEAELSARLEVAETAAADVERERSRLADRVSDLERDAASADDSAGERLRQATERATEFEAEAATYREELRQVTGRANRLETELATARQRLTERQPSADLEAELATASDAARQAAERAEELEDERDRLARRVADLERTPRQPLTERASGVSDAAVAPRRPLVPIPSIESAPAPTPSGTASPTAEAAVAGPSTTAVASGPASTPTAPGGSEEEPSADRSYDSEAPIAASSDLAPAQDASEAIRSRVLEWAAAWSRQDVAAYLDAYAAEFEPESGGRARWEATRRSRLRAPAFIRIELSETEIELEGDGAAVRFSQAYTSNTFADEVLKELRLARRDGEWKIVRERVIE